MRAATAGVMSRLSMATLLIALSYISSSLSAFPELKAFSNQAGFFPRRDQVWEGLPGLRYFCLGGRRYGKKTKVRVVPLSARVRALLEPHFALHETFGISERKMQRMVKPIANRARISRAVSPHVLRHTFSANAIQKGISLPALQRIPGHDHLETTSIYLNLSPEHVLDEYRQKW